MSETSGSHWVPLHKLFVQGYEVVSRLFAKTAEQSLVFSIWDEKTRHELSFCSLILYNTIHRRFLWDNPYIPFLFRLLSSPSNAMQKKKNRKNLPVRVLFRNGNFFSNNPLSGFHVSDLSVFSRQKLTMIRTTDVPLQIHWKNCFDSKHLGCIYKPLTGARFPLLWCQSA